MVGTVVGGVIDAEMKGGMLGAVVGGVIVAEMNGGVVGGLVDGVAVGRFPTPVFVWGATLGR